MNWIIAWMGQRTREPTGKPNDLSPDTIFLVHECEGSNSFLTELFMWHSEDGQSGVTNEKLDICQLKGVFVLFVYLPSQGRKKMRGQSYLLL